MAVAAPRLEELVAVAGPRLGALVAVVCREVRVGFVDLGLGVVEVGRSLVAGVSPGLEVVVAGPGRAAVLVGPRVVMRRGLEVVVGGYRLGAGGGVVL
ncbi:hypothetical protein GCM10022419_056420 [Nonomuraea rosea]|uniref:Uncharacterized protein n=1 Tax=Nonomuraea rosea TaxID=638574 RepID=A0ABP6XQC0_9ACTN